MEKEEGGGEIGKERVSAVGRWEGEGKGKKGKKGKG